MARSPRLFIPGAVYHVYCRTARGEMVFSDHTEATEFVDTIADVKRLRFWRSSTLATRWQKLPCSFINTPVRSVAGSRPRPVPPTSEIWHGEFLIMPRPISTPSQQ